MIGDRSGCTGRVLGATCRVPAKSTLSPSVLANIPKPPCFVRCNNAKNSMSATVIICDLKPCLQVNKWCESVCQIFADWALLLYTDLEDRQLRYIML